MEIMTIKTDNKPSSRTHGNGLQEQSQLESKKNGTTTGANSKEEKRSSFAQLRANLEKNSENSVISSSIDDFHRQQRETKKGDHKTKVETEHLLRSFRGTVLSPATMPKKLGLKSSKSVQPHLPTPESLEAANRAAAAIFVTNTHLYSSLSNNGSANGIDHTSQTTTYRSMVDFYQLQRIRRQQEAMSRYNKGLQLLPMQQTQPTEQTKEGSSVPDAIQSDLPLTPDKMLEDSLVANPSFDKGTDIVQQNSLRPDMNRSESPSNQNTSTEGDSQNPTADIDDPIPSVAPVLVDYKNIDYRGFVFVVHQEHGLLLLHCTRKPKKGPHYQLPGGHIDEAEFIAAAQMSQDPLAQLMIAAQMGAARELFEETGLDVRNSLHRIEPAALRNEITTNSKGQTVVACELNHRLYFFLPVSDDDFLSHQSESSTSSTNCMAPMTEEGSHLGLRLSCEHSGFIFEKDPTTSAKLLRSHSGGNGSKALLLAMKREEEEITEINTSILSIDTSVDEDNANEDAALTATTGDDHDILVLDLENEVQNQEESLTVCDESANEGGQTQINLHPPPEKKNIFSCCFGIW